MALIVEGNICQEAITKVQEDLATRGAAKLAFENLAFVFQFAVDYSDADMKVWFQEIADWFEAKPWTAGHTVYANWRRQEIVIGSPPAIP